MEVSSTTPSSSSPRAVKCLQRGLEPVQDLGDFGVAEPGRQLILSVRVQGGEVQVDGGAGTDDGQAGGVFADASRDEVDGEG